MNKGFQTAADSGFVINDRPRMMIGFGMSPEKIRHTTILEQWDGLIEEIIHNGFGEFYVNARLIRRINGHRFEENTTLRITNEWEIECKIPEDLHPGHLFKWYVGINSLGQRISYVQLLDHQQ